MQLRACKWMVLLVLLWLLIPVATEAKPVIRFSQHGTATTLKIFEGIRDAYYAKYGDDVEIQIDITSYEVYMDKVQLQAASGTLADVVRVPGVLWYGFTDLLEDLQPYLDKAHVNLNGLPPGSSSFDIDHFKDRLVGLSLPNWMVNDVVAWLNLDIFQNNGVQAPTENWTWEQMLGYSKKMTQAHPNGTIRIAGDLGSYRLYRQWYPLWTNVLYSYGGSIFAPDMSESTINSAKSRAAFEFIVRWIQTTPHTPGVWFPTGGIGIHFDWLTQQGMGDIVEKNTFKLGVVTTPKGPAGFGFRSRDITPSYPFAIPKTSQNKEAAWKFLQFLAFEPEALRAYKGTGELPPIPYRQYIQEARDLFLPFHHNYVLPVSDVIAQNARKEFIDPMGSLAQDIYRIVHRNWTPFVEGKVSLNDLDETKRLLDLFLAEKAGDVKTIRERISELQSR